MTVNNMILNGNTLTDILPLSELYTVYSEHRRLGVFVEKGRRCVICDREGNLLLITQEKTGAKHVDLYTDDFVLMTVDHIIPKYICKKIGWTKAQTESMLNKQPMCEPCNGSKADKLITSEDYKKIRAKSVIKPKSIGIEMIRRFVDNEHIFNKSLDNI